MRPPPVTLPSGAICSVMVCRGMVCSCPAALALMGPTERSIVARPEDERRMTRIDSGPRTVASTGIERPAADIVRCVPTVMSYR